MKEKLIMGLVLVVCLGIVISFSPVVKADSGSDKAKDNPAFTAHLRSFLESMSSSNLFFLVGEWFQMRLGPSPAPFTFPALNSPFLPPGKDSSGGGPALKYSPVKDGKVTGDIPGEEPPPPDVG
ncbi:MAG: hypothetical protein ACE5WD_06070 [Candidatus Aminicenantia bacterium]